MAGKPPEHTKWKPGQSGNPSGRPKGLLRKDDVQALMARFWHLTRDELLAVTKDPKSSVGQVMVASVMARAIKDGDYSRLSFLLDRMIGRPTEVIEQTLTTTKDEALDKIGTEKLATLLKLHG